MAPQYEWDCLHCGEFFESLSKPYEPVQCPKCRTYELCKRITSTAPHIQGDGDWSTSQKSSYQRSTEKGKK